MTIQRVIFDEDTMQRICTSQPFCLCVGKVNDGDECCCTGGVAGCSTKHCENCDAPFEIINIDTGVTLEAAA